MKKFIKLYIWFYMILGILGIAIILGKESSIFEILRNTLFWVFGPICVFLYIKGKKWLPTIFWKSYFLLKIVDILYDFFYTKKFDAGVSEITHVFSWFVGVLFIVPVLIVIYRYSFTENG